MYITSTGISTLNNVYYVSRYVIPPPPTAATPDKQTARPLLSPSARLPTARPQQDQKKQAEDVMRNFIERLGYSFEKSEAIYKCIPYH